MNKQGSSPVDEIRDTVHRINELWLAKQYDAIGALVLEHAVIAVPGFSERIRGQAAYVQSYRDYDQACITHEFEPDEPQIDVMDDVAVAVTPFRIVYEINGQKYCERGHDLLVFARSADGWRVAWRNMQSTAADEPRTA